MKLHRRELLGSAALLLIGRATGARAQLLPWRPEAGSPPTPFVPGPWIFFSPAEGAAVEALVDRLIPPDPETSGGKDAGCAVFIDRQLAGPYGRRDGLYLSPPFINGTKQQGPQDEDGPTERYRKALAALDQYCKAQKGGAFASLSDADKDAVIGGLESGATKSRPRTSDQTGSTRTGLSRGGCRSHARPTDPRRCAATAGIARTSSRPDG